MLYLTVGATAAVLLDPHACAGLSRLCVVFPYRGDQLHLPPALGVCRRVVGSPAAVCAARVVHNSGSPWSRGGGNGTGVHSCFTGVWEETPLVTLSSAVLCSDS